MELDLETFLVALYVIVDDLYQSHIQPRMPACGGPPAQMSDSEVLCVGLAVQWSSGDKEFLRESVYNGAPHLQHGRKRNGLRLEPQHDTLPWPCCIVLNNNRFRLSGHVYILVPATLVRCSAIRPEGAP